MKELDFNINDMVKVKLTKLGRKIYIDSYTRYGLEEPKIVIDVNGYTKFQMWTLMEVFGNYCGMARELPFETNIKIMVKEEEK